MVNAYFLILLNLINITLFHCTMAYFSSVVSPLLLSVHVRRSTFAFIIVTRYCFEAHTRYLYSFRS